jgi:hypothetical protein
MLLYFTVTKSSQDSIKVAMEWINVTSMEVISTFASLVVLIEGTFARSIDQRL